MNTPSTKRCRVCQEDFPATVEHFHPRPDSPDGLRNNCRVCQNKRSKKYRADTIDDRKAYFHKYYQENIERLRQKQRDYESQNRERAIERVKLWRESNRDRRRSYESAYRAKNSDRLRANKAAWRKKNPRVYDPTKYKYKYKYKYSYHPEKARIHRLRRATRKASLPNDFTAQDWQFALDYFGGCCATCDRPLLGIFHTAHADHWLPMANTDCPGTIPSNIVPLCGGLDGCNESKRDKQPATWLIRRFGEKQAAIIAARIQEFFSKVRQV